MSRNQGKPLNMGAEAPRAAPSVEDPSGRAMESLGGMTGMVRTATQYQTAIAVIVPRDLDKVRARVRKEAELLADDFVYSWEQKDKHSDTGTSRIEGMSIEGAMILLRNWGNCVCEPSIEREEPDSWVLRATFIDLETGTNITRLFRQRKGAAFGGYESERKLDIAFQIGQSKAIRNVIDRSVPAWLRDEAIRTAKTSAAKQYEDLPASLAKVRAACAKMKPPIDDAALLRKVRKPFEQWFPIDFVNLKTIFNAIREGATTVETEFFSVAQPTDEEMRVPVTPANDVGIVDAVGEAVPTAEDATPAAKPEAVATTTVAATVAATPATTAQPEPPKPAEPVADAGPRCAAPDCGKPFTAEQAAEAVMFGGRPFHGDCFAFLKKADPPANSPSDVGGFSPPPANDQGPPKKAREPGEEG